MARSSFTGYFRGPLTAITRYKLRKLLKYALVTLVVAWVLMLFSGEHMGLMPMVWVLLGLWMGVLEEFLFGDRFRALAAPLQFLGKAVLINLFTILLVGMIFQVDPSRFPELSADPSARVGDIFSMRKFYQFVLRVVLVTSVALLVVQLEEMIGRRTILGVLFARYEKPVTEERVVLTMDLVGSSALAERLGDMLYYRFLNRVHALSTDAVLRNEAEIYKYVGDEVIFTWPVRLGVRDGNCLDLYFDIMARIQAHAEEFEREFGHVPAYRAAVHAGPVIAAQVGHVKRSIEFSGDVMNSVSRMVDVAKHMKVGLLVSSELLGKMPRADERFKLSDEHVVPVKGRRREVRVHVVERLSEFVRSAR